MSTLPVCFANLVIVLSMGAIVVSLAMEYWVKVTVDRNKLPSDIQSQNKEIYYSRQRGLFRTCFEDNAQWLKNYDPVGKKVQGNCLNEDIFKIANNSGVVSLGKSYSQRNDLLKVHLSFQVISIVFLIATLVAGILGCHRFSSSTLRISGVLAFLGSLFMSGALAAFHVYEHLEKQKIANEIFYNVWSTLPALRGNFTYNYHFCYMLGWIGMALAFITGLVYLFLARGVIEEKEKLKDRLERYADEREKNFDNLVKNPVRQYGRGHQRDPYEF